MNLKKLKHQNNAQVLGLPMYLIIVMIVAVAVIAAVLFMIPQGTRTMNAVILQNQVIAEEAGNAGSYSFSQSYDVTVKVLSNDKRSDPISGATVSLIGAGVAVSNSTNANGEAILTVQPELAENVNEAYLRLKVKAAGFEDIEDLDSVMIVRL